MKIRAKSVPNRDSGSARARKSTARVLGTVNGTGTDPHPVILAISGDFLRIVRFWYYSSRMVVVTYVHFRFLFYLNNFWAFWERFWVISSISSFSQRQFWSIWTMVENMCVTKSWEPYMTPKSVSQWFSGHLDRAAAGRGQFRGPGQGRFFAPVWYFFLKKWPKFNFFNSKWSTTIKYQLNVQVSYYFYVFGLFHGELVKIPKFDLWTLWIRNFWDQKFRKLKIRFFFEKNYFFRFIITKNEGSDLIL